MKICAQLSSLYNKVMTPRLLSSAKQFLYNKVIMSRHISRQDIANSQNVFEEIQDCTSAELSIFTRLSFMKPFACFLNWKFISKVKFEHVEDIKIYTTVKLHTMLKREVSSALTNKKKWRKKYVEYQEDNLEGN